MARGEFGSEDSHTHPSAGFPRLPPRCDAHGIISQHRNNLYGTSGRGCVLLQLDRWTLRFELHVILLCPKI